MYFIKSESTFESAHFLSGYDGDCKNIHGHSFKIYATVQSETLQEGGFQDGMVIDFGILKQSLKKITDEIDHALIYQEGTLSDIMLSALNGEGFKLAPVPFRPTAENFSRYFYYRLKDEGYNIKEVTVYETQKNCASYTE